MKRSKSTQIRRAINRGRRFLAIKRGRPELVKAQFVAFRGQMPLLYMILLVNSWILAFAFGPRAPLELVFAVPIVFTLVSIARVWTWRQSPARTVPPDTAYRELSRSNLLAWVLGIGFSIWALSLYQYGDVYLRVHVAFFMGITVVACIYCLSHLPAAAFAVFITVNAAFAGFFLSTGNLNFVAMTINVLLVTSAMMFVLVVNYRDFNALVESRRRIEAEKAKIIALSDENFRLANLDSLTNLANRRSFFATLSKLTATVDRRGGTLVLGILDLDGFKPINDTYGHSVGDALLCRLADRMQNHFAGRAEIFRLGGDEFAVVFQVATAAGALEEGKRLCSTLVEPIQLPNCVARVGGTMGLAVYPEMAGSHRELFERADYAMYRAKRGTGRGDAWLFTDEDEDHIRRSSAIENALKDADLERELSLMFQPIVDVANGQTVGFEALARWQSPELGQVSPTDFIPTAERAGLINGLTVVLLRKALTAASQWPEPMRLSFNLSALDVSNPENLMRLVAIIGQSSVSPRLIEFEITETAMVSDIAIMMDAVEILKRVGVGISVDDFGSGFSSLKQVHQLRLDKMKIDRSFVTNIDNNIAGQKIIKSLVSLCSDLKMACVVEGVETAAELKTVRDLGCQLVQGYYYSRPMRPEEVSSFLDRSAVADADIQVLP